MHVPRIPIDEAVAIGDRIALSSDTAHHLLRVLRLPDGAELRLFNGEPGDWHARLAVSGKHRACAEILSFEPRAVESSLDITLVQGISRGQRMDYTLEKGTELGLSRVVPVVMERSHAAPEGERVARKQRHWRGVLAAAAAQSGRTRVPGLADQRPFADWLAEVDARAHPHVLLDPDAPRGPGGLEGSPAALTLLAGPEGGFTARERDAAYAAGCRGLRLGPRVLRTETAAVAALAALQACYGDLG